MERKFLNQKGQAGAVFRLMIDAIIGLVVLTLIISTLVYFNDLRYTVSKAELNDVITSAINSPNGRVVASTEKLLFAKGDGYTAIQLQDITSRPAQCFAFESGFSMVTVETDKSSVFFQQQVETFVYAQCFPGEYAVNCSIDSEDCCIIQCTISFGKKLTPPDSPN